MLSSASIIAIRERATARARKARRKPIKVSKIDPKDVLRSIPFLGEYIPEGWRAAPGIDGDQITWFVDLWGYGSEDEPALTHKAFAEVIARLVRSGDTWGLGALEVGEFQAVIGAYLPAIGDFTQSGELTAQELKDVLA